jgi:S-disulfanyl-L-cysteine oxidoreductase SoxD
MRSLFNFFVPAMALTMCVGALAQGPTYKLGRTPTEEEIRAWDIAISPDGKELPPGSGSAAEGISIFAQKCMRCHGPGGRGGGVGGVFVSPTGPGGAIVTSKGPPFNFPLATTLWDAINRSMPRYQEGSLSANQVYAVTAALLYWNGVIQEGDVMDAKSLPKVQMPNRDGFVPLRLEDIRDMQKRGCHGGHCP